MKQENIVFNFPKRTSTFVLIEALHKKSNEDDLGLNK